MKLVRECYGEERLLMVGESILKEGICFGENNDILSNAPVEIFKAWEAQKEDGIEYFSEFIQNSGYEYGNLSDDSYYSLEELEDLRKEWKFYFNSFNFEYESTKFLGYKTEQYIEYWDGHNHRQIKVDVVDEKVEKIEEDIDGWQQEKTSQYDLYKVDGNYCLVYNSYYQGSLDEVENDNISIDELKERFNYEIE